MDKMLEMLKTVASKLGTTVEYLWPTFVKKVSIESGLYSVMCIILVIAGLVVAKKVHTSLLKAKEKDGELEEVWYVISIFTFFTLSMVSFIAFVNLPSQIVNIFAPEPEALRQIMQLIK